MREVRALRMPSVGKQLVAGQWAPISTVFLRGRRSAHQATEPTDLAGRLGMALSVTRRLPAAACKSGAGRGKGQAAFGMDGPRG